MKDFYFNTADALGKAKADQDKPVTPVVYKPVLSSAGVDTNIDVEARFFQPKGTGKLTLHNAAQRQWVSLTPEQVRQSFFRTDTPPSSPPHWWEYGNPDYMAIYRSIDANLRKLNGGQA